MHFVAVHTSTGKEIFISKKGKGPGEFVFPFWNLHVVAYETNRIVVFDVAQTKYVTQRLGEEGATLKQEVTLGRSSSIITAGVMLDEKHIALYGDLFTNSFNVQRMNLNTSEAIPHPFSELITMNRISAAYMEKLGSHQYRLPRNINAAVVYDI